MEEDYGFYFDESSSKTMTYEEKTTSEEMKSEGEKEEKEEEGHGELLFADPFEIPWTPTLPTNVQHKNNQKTLASIMKERESQMEGWRRCNHTSTWLKIRKKEEKRFEYRIYVKDSRDKKYRLRQKYISAS